MREDKKKSGVVWYGVDDKARERERKVCTPNVS